MILFWFTPTRVGTTRRLAARPAAAPVHPHACGDNVVLSSRSMSMSGSPPRVWGQLLRRFTREAGELTVHPHACGDNPLDIAVAQLEDGSPPRVWGQQGKHQRIHRLIRFTPTRVGTTLSTGSITIIRAVHPHACGDNKLQADGKTPLVGSPPRVWGQQVPSQPKAAAVPVHPHACGDNLDSCPTALLCCGSPPRVWGQPLLDLAESRLDRFTPTRVGTTHGSLAFPAAFRFTPTRVGTTFTTRFTSSRNSVHPHACGDNIRGSRAISAGFGSPPRVWGQLAFPGKK